MSRLTAKPRGFIVHSSRITQANLRTNDGGTGNSSYTSSGSRPGDSVAGNADSGLRPRVTHEQGTADVLVAIDQAGNPGRKTTSVHGKYRLSTDTDNDDYRGWNDPVLISHSPNPVTFAYGSPQHFAMATIPSTQKPVVVYTKTRASTHDLRARTFDWSTSEWAAEVAVDTDLGVTLLTGNGGPLCLIVLPETETLLCCYHTTAADVVDIAQSTDSGATWSRYAVGAADASGVTNPARIRGAALRRDVGILIEEETTGDWVQVASNSLGGKFSAVESRSAVGHDIDYLTLPDGSGIVITYRDQSSSFGRSIRLTGPFQPTSEGTVVTIEGTLALGDCTSWVDADGVLYFLGRESGAGSIDLVHLWYSEDSGDTWTEYTTIGAVADSNLMFTSGQDTEYIKPAAATTARGWAFVAYDSLTATTTVDDDIGCLMLGGWSSLSAHHGDQSTLPGDLTVTTSVPGRHIKKWMMGWGYDHADSRGRPWFPYVDPVDLSDWGITATGAAAATLTADGLEIVSSAGESALYAHAGLSGNVDAASYLFEVELDAADGDKTNSDVVINLGLSDGANDVQVQIRLESDGFQAYDVNAAADIGGVASVDMTTFVQIAIYMDLGTGSQDGNLEIWYKKALATTWTEHLNVTHPSGLTEAAGLLLPQIEWGHTTVAATSRWRMVCYRGAVAAASNAHYRYDTDSHLGRPLGELPYPIPEAGTTTGEAFLIAENGPGRVGDTFTIAPSYDYPLSNAFLKNSPSRSAVYRTTDKSLMRLAFDLTDNSALGSAYTIGLSVINCNASNVALKGWNGSAWVTLGNMSMLINWPGANLKYDMSGDIIRPGSGSASATRFVQAGEVGWVTLDLTGTPVAREAAHNTGGVWIDSATATVNPHIRLKGTTAGDRSAAPDECDLYVKDAAMVVHLDLNTQYSRFAIEISANQVTPWDYYQLGGIVVGRVVGFGRQWSRSWSHRLIPQTDDSVIDGVRRVRKLSDPVEEWSLSWVDGVNLLDLRQSSIADIDYLGASAANKAPLVADQDALWQLQQLVREMESGELPVCALAEVPDTTATVVSDPSMFIVGTSTSGVRATHVVGDEGTGNGEVYRLDSFVVRSNP